MVKGNILYITTMRHNVSAEKIRVKYFKQALINAGYNVMDFELRIGGLNKFIWYLTKFLPKRLVYASRNADLIISTSPPLLNTIIGYKIAKKLKIPLIVDIRDIWEEYAKTKYHLSYFTLFIKRIIRDYYEALMYSPKIIVTTNHMRRYYEEILGIGEKIVVISNGTDPDIIKCSEGICRDYDLVYLADFNSPYHGLEFLLRALKGSKLSLIIIGSGKYLRTIKKEIQKLRLNNKILFAGRIPFEKLSSYLCRAKVGVVGRPFINNPEYLYTIPVKIYDYLAAELPILAYGPLKSAVSEFISEYDIGYYCDIHDLNYITKLLIKLVDNYSYYRIRCRKLALKYDRKKLSSRIVKLVEKLV